MLAGALTQARDARITILDVMAEAIDVPDEMSPYAPRIITVKVPVDKIGEVIGPKGKMINPIQEDTGADISIEDDGTVFIGAVDGPSAEAARAAINAIANPQMPEVGERFLGTVVKTTTFGAFVSLLPGKDGLLHISEVRKLVGGKRIDNVEDVVKVGQKIQVELKEIDPRQAVARGCPARGRGRRQGRVRRDGQGRSQLTPWVAPRRCEAARNLRAPGRFDVECQSRPARTAHRQGEGMGPKGELIPFQPVTKARDRRVRESLMRFPAPIRTWLRHPPDAVRAYSQRSPFRSRARRRPPGPR